MEYVEIHAYDNSAFNSGGGSSGHEMEERRVDSKAEVERLGYEMYNGKGHENRWALQVVQERCAPPPFLFSLNL